MVSVLWRGKQHKICRRALWPFRADTWILKVDIYITCTSDMLVGERPVGSQLDSDAACNNWIIPAPPPTPPTNTH